MAMLSQQTTAEHIVGCIDAVVSCGAPTSAPQAAAFLDIQEKQAKAALTLAVELGLLKKSGAAFDVNSPLCRLLATAQQTPKAAILRIFLESYRPFTLFRERLLATLDPTVSSRQAKTQLGLGATRDEVKDTLVSLGTYSRALSSTGGGQYDLGSALLPDTLSVIAKQCIDLTSAEQRIEIQIGPVANATLDRASVISPLANALIRAGNGDARGAVVEAGNAVESFLVALSTSPQLATAPNLTGANGIGAKIDRFDQAAALHKKICAVGKYLSNVRNAADHGTDSDLGKPWEILPSTGVEYVFVACSFIRSASGHVATQEGAI